MTDLDPSQELKGPTVAACANECLESFQQCLISASSVHPREVSMVEDQLARFSSWASNIGVFAPGSASMDHRLRFASEVQSVVTSLLESLNYRVQTCSKSLAQLADSSTADASTTANDRLGQSFLDIAAEITRLNKISNTIRRASKDTQVLKASNFQIKDDEGENAEPLLLSHFEHHIGDWFPCISENIRQRLARAMLLRRKRILYRRHRQGNTSIRSENTISQASVTLPDAQPAAGSSLQTTSKKKVEKSTINRPASKVAPSQVKSATTLAPEKFKMVSSSPSVVSASRTIASGKHQVLTYPPAPGFAAKRRYERLKSQRIVEAAESTELGLRELLELDLQAIGEITCPYCLYALPAAEVFDERKWQNHVKNDLDPYVCLFEECDQSDVLYTHSDEWLSHLHQHGKVWWCSSHREIGPFSTLEDYMKHMREVHNTKLSDRQLRVVANRNSRKVTKLFSSCPLCGREESEVDGRLEDHLAGHLRSLALKSLPSYQDEIPDDFGDGNNSIDGSRPRSRSTLREMEEEKEEMLQEGAGSFWDSRTPQLTQDIPVNFLGDIYFELDLEDSEARAKSLVFDTMGFKGSSENVDDDPILQSMLQQLARTEAINVGTDGSSNLSAEQGMAASSKPPMDETSEQDELGDAIPQQHVKFETSHAQPIDDCSFVPLKPMTESYGQEELDQGRGDHVSNVVQGIFEEFKRLNCFKKTTHEIRSHEIRLHVTDDLFSGRLGHDRNLEIFISCCPGNLTIWQNAECGNYPFDDLAEHCICDRISLAMHHRRKLYIMVNSKGMFDVTDRLPVHPLRWDSFDGISLSELLKDDVFKPIDVQSYLDKTAEKRLDSATKAQVALGLSRCLMGFFDKGLELATHSLIADNVYFRETSTNAKGGKRRLLYVSLRLSPDQDISSDMVKMFSSGSPVALSFAKLLLEVLYGNALKIQVKPNEKENLSSWVELGGVVQNLRRSPDGGPFTSKYLEVVDNCLSLWVTLSNCNDRTNLPGTIQFVRKVIYDKIVHKLELIAGSELLRHRAESHSIKRL